MIPASLYSSAKHDWRTPPEVFQWAQMLFGTFDLDAAASHENALCARYYTAEDDSLKQPWRGNVWCNPPYGRKQIEFIRKAAIEAHNDTAVTLLIPARPDTSAWQDVIFEHADIIIFIRGRLRFQGAQHAAPFPSALVHFCPPQYTTAEPLIVARAVGDDLNF